MEAVEVGEVTYLALTVKLEVLFRFQRVWIWLFGSRFNALGDVEEDLLGAEHTVGV